MCARAPLRKNSGNADNLKQDLDGHDCTVSGDDANGVRWGVAYPRHWDPETGAANDFSLVFALLKRALTQKLVRSRQSGFFLLLFTKWKLRSSLYSAPHALPGINPPMKARFFASMHDVSSTFPDQCTQ